jgi:hypothetical protein
MKHGLLGHFYFGAKAFLGERRKGQGINHQARKISLIKFGSGHDILGRRKGGSISAHWFIGEELIPTPQSRRKKI